MITPDQVLIMVQPVDMRLGLDGCKRPTTPYCNDLRDRLI
jgi:hypothetical protein